MKLFINLALSALLLASASMAETNNPSSIYVVGVRSLSDRTVTILPATDPEAEKLLSNPHLADAYLSQIVGEQVPSRTYALRCDGNTYVAIQSGRLSGKLIMAYAVAIANGGDEVAARVAMAGVLQKEAPIANQVQLPFDNRVLRTGENVRMPTQKGIDRFLSIALAAQEDVADESADVLEQALHARANQPEVIRAHILAMQPTISAQNLARR